MVIAIFIAIALQTNYVAITLILMQFLEGNEDIGRYWIAVVILHDCLYTAGSAATLTLL